jgi:hypothetical protein
MPPPRPLLRAFDALATAILPVTDAIPEGASGCAAALERGWPDLQPMARASLALMVGAVEVSVVLRTGRRLESLPVSRRTALCDHLERRASPPLRSAFLGVKTLILVLAAADPAVERRLGTDAWPPNLLRGGPR